VGKTTFLKDYFKEVDALWLNADDADIRQLLSNQNSTSIRQVVGNNTTVIIDEAQRVENIGITLKIIHDNYPQTKVIVTGSSSLDLANKLNEPLTGRKWELNLYPISTMEMIDHHGRLDENRLIEHRMIFGYYPDVINNPEGSTEILKELTNSYLYQDLLLWEDIKKPQKLQRLLQALAFQIGQQVSYNEVGQMVGLNHETIQRYIDLLGKAFVLFELPSFSRNLRNELKKSRKIYFYDLGIRNAIINNFRPIDLRDDAGSLWENYLIIERMKYKAYQRQFTDDYFWRTHAQQEIDFIEDYNGQLSAYEFKYNIKKKARITKTFINAYPDSLTHIVDRENYLDFITGVLSEL
jgi:predicted AAA+ superfamily ATPase